VTFLFDQLPRGHFFIGTMPAWGLLAYYLVLGILLGILSRINVSGEGG
jgi:hypothetical protein